MTRECAECTTLFAPDLDKCPHCGAEYREDAVPKISREGGPSYAGVDSPAEGLTPEETSEDDRYPFTVPTESDAGQSDKEAADTSDTQPSSSDKASDSGSSTTTTTTASTSKSSGGTGTTKR